MSNVDEALSSALAAFTAAARIGGPHEGRTPPPYYRNVTQILLDESAVQSINHLHYRFDHAVWIRPSDHLTVRPQP
jgi:hypothetical protein